MTSKGTTVESGTPHVLYLECAPGEHRAILVDGAGRPVRYAVSRDGRPHHSGAIWFARATGIDKATGGAFLPLGENMIGLVPRARGLTEGQALPVQIARSPRPGKGPSLNTAPQLWGRYLTLRLPDPSGAGGGRNGTPRRAAQSEVLAALNHGEEDGSLTLRAPGHRVAMPTLAAEHALLRARRQGLQDALAQRPAPPCLLESSPDFPERMLRDAPPGARIVIDDREIHRRATALADARWPDLAISYHREAESLFDSAGLGDLPVALLSRRVAIPGGGRLTIQHTEAMWVIDVDSAGDADAARGGPDAIVRFNRRAADEIIAQIMLRELSGLIVIDFANMRGSGPMRQLLQHMRGRARVDAQRMDILGGTAAGLVEITRRRGGPALDEMMLVPEAQGEGPALAADARACALLRAAATLRGPGRPVAYGTPAVLALFADGGPLAAALAAVSRKLGGAPEFRPGPDSDPPRVEMELPSASVADRKPRHRRRPPAESA